MRRPTHAGLADTRHIGNLMEAGLTPLEAIHAALNHPNILAVHDIGFHHGTPFIVPELLEGERQLDSGAIAVPSSPIVEN